MAAYVASRDAVGERLDPRDRATVSVGSEELVTSPMLSVCAEAIVTTLKHAAAIGPSLALRRSLIPLGRPKSCCNVLISGG